MNNPASAAEPVAPYKPIDELRRQYVESEITLGQFYWRLVQIRNSDHSTDWYCKNAFESGILEKKAKGGE